MNSVIIDLCSICITNISEYYTECNHGYCINCLSRINKCALCRKSLLRSQLCIEIRSKHNHVRTINNNVISILIGPNVDEDAYNM
jgi:hypothetical protein